MYGFIILLCGVYYPPRLSEPGKIKIKNINNIKERNPVGYSYGNVIIDVLKTDVDRSCLSEGLF